MQYRRGDAASGEEAGDQGQERGGEGHEGAFCAHLGEGGIGHRLGPPDGDRPVEIGYRLRDADHLRSVVAGILADDADSLLPGGAGGEARPERVRGDARAGDGARHSIRGHRAAIPRRDQEADVVAAEAALGHALELLAEGRESTPTTTYP